MLSIQVCKDSDKSQNSKLAAETVTQVKCDKSETESVDISDKLETVENVNNEENWENRIIELEHTLREREEKISKLEKHIKLLKEENEVKKKHRHKYKCDSCSFLSYSKIRLKKHKEVCNQNISDKDTEDDHEPENDAVNDNILSTNQCKELSLLNQTINFS